jgi:hypothetical protein
MEITIEQVGSSDLKIACDATAVDMTGKTLFVRPKDQLPYQHFKNIHESLTAMFPKNIVVIIPPSLIMTTENKVSAIRQIEDLLEKVRRTP